MFLKNLSNCSKYGVEISDTIASWALKGFVAALSIRHLLVIFVLTL